MKRPKKNIAPPPPAVAPLPDAPPKARFSFRVTVHECTRLRVGDVIDYEGLEHVIISVGPSSARIIPLMNEDKVAIKFRPRFADKDVEFTAPVRHGILRISPNSESKIKRRLGPKWQQSPLRSKTAD